MEAYHFSRLWEPAPSLTIQSERAEVIYSNFMGTWTTHSIAITPVTRDASLKVLERRKNRVIKQFKGGPLWDQELGDQRGGEECFSNYRWQLEAFVQKIEKGEMYKGPVGESGAEY